jgi:hypothetical protein
LDGGKKDKSMKKVLESATEKSMEVLWKSMEEYGKVRKNYGKVRKVL